MRLFVGVRPDGEFLESLSRLKDSLRAAGVAGQYSPDENLHMTLAFIGEWPENVTGVLPRVKEPFIRLKNVGAFTGSKVLWAGVDRSEPLFAAAESVRESLAANGIPFDPKPFNPHITLARKPVLPNGLDLKDIPVVPAVMTVKDICLYRSDRGENGMIYRVIGRV